MRVGAVSYLNTVPLVWGMLHGAQQDGVDLSFSIPAMCAEQIESGTSDVGIVPVAEIARQGLEIVSEVGIACQGAVRSILLVSKKPMREIRTLAADASSRTSVKLAEVILRERYGAEPEITRARPDLTSMLAGADAALLIGDPALRLNPEALGLETLDLGTEWWDLTGLPMVFAAWAGALGVAGSEDSGSSLETRTISGNEHLAEIIDSEYQRRGVSRELAGEYLTTVYPVRDRQARAKRFAVFSRAGPAGAQHDGVKDFLIA